MNSSFKLAAVAAACALSTVAAHAALDLNANMEINSDYTSAHEAVPSQVGQGGRVEVNIGSTTKEGDAFVTAAASTEVGVGGGGLNAVNSFIQIGNSAVDFKLGRFEASDGVSNGKDTVVTKVATTAAVGYSANTLRGRDVTGNSQQWHGVIGVNAGAARIELGLVASKGTNAVTETSGFRPAVSFGAGPFTVKATYEAITVSDTTPGVGGSKQTGYALAAGYALSADNSVNVYYANNDKIKQSSFGLNGTFGPAGVGYVSDNNSLAATTVTVNTLYAAYTLPLLGVKGASITPAISSSSVSGEAKDSVQAFRVRMNYSF